jgi:hypothetical protein
MLVCAKRLTKHGEFSSLSCPSAFHDYKSCLSRESECCCAAWEGKWRELDRQTLRKIRIFCKAFLLFKKNKQADDYLLKEVLIPVRDATKNNLGVPAMLFDHNHLCCGRFIRGLYYQPSGHIEVNRRSISMLQGKMSCWTNQHADSPPSMAGVLNISIYVFPWHEPCMYALGPCLVWRSHALPRRIPLHNVWQGIFKADRAVSWRQEKIPGHPWMREAY